ncbi:MAG: hypothetical protein KAT48_14180 [Bacteroidales bacterium]|nr:hypothetical protein [Bacteroidales bacterium]
MTSGDFTELMGCIAWIMGQFIDCLRNVYIGDFSLLSILLAPVFLSLVLWFISKVLGIDYHNKSSEFADDMQRSIDLDEKERQEYVKKQDEHGERMGYTKGGKLTGRDHRSSEVYTGRLDK